MAMRIRTGFTLIELLVVVTIIVVLLALLTPALDKAIYQAELVVCGGNLKGIAGGVTQYAFDFQRSYPYRDAVHNPNIGNYQPSQLTWRAADANYDDRQKLRPYVGISAFNCPLSGEFNPDTQDPDSFVYSNYVLWFGFRYTQVSSSLPPEVPRISGNPVDTRAPQPGMLRVGNKWEAVSERTRRFTWLAGDQEFWGGFGSSWNAHPDLEGITSNVVLDDAPATHFVPAKNPNGKYATSYWGAPGRGTTENNYANADGSVTRFTHTSPKFFQPWETVGLAPLPLYNQAAGGSLLVRIQQ
jgi:prepilin-type N-terminal cleavage/methylation domain-containing protein